MIQSVRFTPGLLGLLFISIPALADELPSDDQFFKTEVSNKEIKIMTYNVENLFDSVHDIEDGVDKNDYEFLPLSHPKKEAGCQTISNPYYKKKCKETDWTAEVYENKLKRIAQAIRANGELPDLLALQEVENQRVLSRLAKELGYENFRITQSPDSRGIDVALLYRTEKLKQYGRMTQINVTEKARLDRPTRNILHVAFEFQGGILDVYVNHWPSQSAPPQVRMAVAQVLQQTIRRHAKRAQSNRKEHYVIALGDFNTLHRELPNAAHHVLHDPHWEGALVDAQDLENRTKSAHLKKMPPTSYWYVVKNAWNYLDRILLSANFYDKKGAELAKGSLRIVAPSFMRRNFYYGLYPEEYFYKSSIRSVPKKFNVRYGESSKQGYSDHYPISIKVVF